jgi:hypothetical protein
MAHGIHVRHHYRSILVLAWDQKRSLVKDALLAWADLSARACMEMKRMSFSRSTWCERLAP